jgi:integrase
MEERLSSNPTFSATETSANAGVFITSAPSIFTSAPTGQDIVLGVEGPNTKTIEMMHQIKCVTCNGNVNQRWYVEYYTTDVATLKRVRKREYGFINKEKNPDVRNNLLLQLKAQIINQLELDHKKRADLQLGEANTTNYYINKYILEKKKVLEAITVKNYGHYLDNFKHYLTSKSQLQQPPHKITKQVIYEYRDTLTYKLTNRGVNNHMDCLKGFFAYLISNYDGVLVKNPVSGITKLQSKSENHIAYSKQQAESISKHLLEHDLQLLQYCRFVAYGFLRCNEARKLKVGDIDFNRKTITLPVDSIKSKKRTVKPVLDVLFNHIIDMNLRDLPSDYYVFSTNGKPGLNQTYECYFQKRYAKVKKKFNLNEKYTIYSFRHTFVCELLDSNNKWHEIMKYTGHTTMAAFEKYARSIMNKPATDLSSSIKINF